MNTFKQIIETMRDSLIEKDFGNGVVKVITKDDSPSWVTEIIHDAHGNDMPRDDIYSVIKRVVEHLFNNDVDDIDDAKDSLSEVESDVYTRDLLEWLAGNLGNIDYLGQAAEMGITDGFQLLSYGQLLFIQEIGCNLLDSINDHIDEIEEVLEEGGDN